MLKSIFNIRVTVIISARNLIVAYLSASQSIAYICTSILDPAFCLLLERTKPSQHINPRKQVGWHQTLDFPSLIIPTSPVKHRACLSVRGHICVFPNAILRKDLHILLSFQHLKNNILFSSPKSREREEALRRMSRQQPSLEQKALCRSHFKL